MPHSSTAWAGRTGERVAHNQQGDWAGNGGAVLLSNQQRDWAGNGGAVTVRRRRVTARGAYKWGLRRLFLAFLCPPVTSVVTWGGLGSYS